MELEVKIRGLIVDPATNSPIVLLKELDGEGILPIWVGPYEANSIASEIEKMSPQRPMTHDLLRNVIAQMGGVVNRVIVTELRDNTFYAVIEIVSDGQTFLIDSRPSDAIALALRTDSPIFIREEVFEASRHSDIEKIQADDILDEEVEWPEEIDDVSDYKM
ncbi:MAG: bifunctional nuclease family protein [Gammaproteobacteria bacterium]|nr:bifunctional nuclease family protein [Gammaproteobacteria bacterium]